MADMRVTLKACRVNTGMTQVQFADAVGVAPGTVGRWEDGKSEPTITNLRKISELSTIPMGAIVVGGNPFEME